MLKFFLFHILFFPLVTLFKSTSPVYGSVLYVVQNVQCICEKCILSSLKVLPSKSIMSDEGCIRFFALLLKLVLIDGTDIELHLHSEFLQLCLGTLVLRIWAAC